MVHAIDRSGGKMENLGGGSSDGSEAELHHTTCAWHRRPAMAHSVLQNLDVDFNPFFE